MTNPAEFEEFFGSPDQKAMLGRAAALRRLTRDDPRFSYYGRSVALTNLEPDAVELVTELTRLQGASACFYVPKADAETFRKALENNGLKTDRFEVLRGGCEVVEASRTLLESRRLPADLEVSEITLSTPASVLSALNDVASSSDVLLLAGSVLRGAGAPSVCLFAHEPSGQGVACAASVACNPAEGDHGEDAWWGMLATREDRRGAGIALVLGAMTIIAMHDKHGFEGFMTGVREGNTPSERLCEQLAIVASDYCVIGALDPSLFSGGRMTK